MIETRSRDRPYCLPPTTLMFTNMLLLYNSFLALLLLSSTGTLLASGFSHHPFGGRQPHSSLASQAQKRHCPFLHHPSAFTTSSSSSTTTTRWTLLSVPRGGGGSVVKATSSSSGTDAECPVTTGAATVFSSLWGTFGVVYILAKAIKRVLPIAMEPFGSSVVALSQFELGAYIVTCLWFAYVEGYKGFQQKFAPLVVKRSFTLIPGKNGTKWYHYIFAPMYCMGLIHATKKRQITSWSVTLGVATIVALVKKLPYPWRNIIDAGVVTGLTWGSISILFFYIKTWITGETPRGTDAALPLSSSSTLTK